MILLIFVFDVTWLLKRQKAFINKYGVNTYYRYLFECYVFPTLKASILVQYLREYLRYILRLASPSLSVIQLFQ